MKNTWAPLCALLLAAMPATLLAAGTDDWYGLSVSYDTQATNSDFFLDDVGVKTVRIYATWRWSDRSGVETHGNDVFAKARVYKAKGYNVVMLFDNAHSSAVDVPGYPGSACTYANVHAFFTWAKEYRGPSGTDAPMKDVIDYWEILNELNLTQYWTGTPTIYVNNVLKAAWDALKAGGDNEPVVGGSFTLGQGTWGGTNVTQAYVDAGYLNYCDYAGCHPYGDNSVSQQITFVNNCQSIFGNKPIVITEWGFKTGPTDATIKALLDSARPFLYEKVKFACLYRLTKTSYPGIVTYSSPTYTPAAPFYEMYKAWPKATGVAKTYQAEAQSFTSSGGSTSTVTDGSQQFVELAATAGGAYMEFTAANVPAGNYDVYVRYKRGTNRGRFNATLNGAALGSTIDQYGSSYAATYVRAKLGQVTISTSGAVTVRLTVDAAKNASSTGWRINADMVEFQRSAEDFEADLESYTASGATAAVTAAANQSGGQYLLLNADGVGDYVQVTLADLLPGQYTLKVGYRTAPDRGTHTVAFNGATIGSTINQYTTANIPTLVTLGTVSVSGTSATVRLTVDGKHASSTGYKLAVDRIQLIPLALTSLQTTLAPTKDAYVDQASSTSNYGTAATLSTKASSSAARYTYLTFNLSGVTTVSSAKVRVYGSVTNAGATISCREALSSSWSEGSINWGNKPAMGSANLASLSVSSTSQYREWDVTAFIQAQAGNQVTLAFISNNSNVGTFHSREGANPPQLVVNP